MESVITGNIARRHQKRSFVHSRLLDIVKLAIDVVSGVSEQKKSASIDPRSVYPPLMSVIANDTTVLWQIEVTDMNLQSDFTTNTLTT